MTILFVIGWLLLGALGAYIFQDYLNKKYPSVAEPITIKSMMKYFPIIIAGPICLITALIWTM